MKPWLRQGILLAAALIVPVLLSLVLLPLRAHVSDVLIALILLTVSAVAVARGELLLSLLAATSTALSFDYFFAVPYDARWRNSVICPAACIRPSWSRPASGRPSARWPGIHRSRCGCRCGPTAGSPSPQKPIYRNGQWCFPAASREPARECVLGRACRPCGIHSVSRWPVLQCRRGSPRGERAGRQAR